MKVFEILSTFYETHTISISVSSE